MPQILQIVLEDKHKSSFLSKKKKHKSSGKSIHLQQLYTSTKIWEYNNFSILNSCIIQRALSFIYFYN